LVVGLGNPGSRYENTRHNIGFMAVEAFARRHDLRFKGSKHRADVAAGAINGLPILLAKPVTFMNESGNAVVRLTRYFNVPGERVLVVCDDLDLPFGTMRLRSGGGRAGTVD
jgi:PTH1 family peptidyl-tRNA hydrolase